MFDTAVLATGTSGPHARDTPISGRFAINQTVPR
jgi:hypothetical protein